MPAVPSPPAPIRKLVSRYDPQVFDVGRRRARIRLEGAGSRSWDVVLGDSEARLDDGSESGRPDAVLTADTETWKGLADDVATGLDAFRAGRLHVRHDLHLGVGFLAATAPSTNGRGLRFRSVDTEVGEISTMEAGSGDPVLMLHGLGATKASFLPTVAALARGHRAIAIDLPGFGDSVKPIGAAYDARFFARSVVALLDALDLESAHVVGNSMGGRVALEVGMAHPDRTGRLVLLAPSLAWLRERRFAPLLRLVPPQLGLLQPAPRPIVETLVRNLVPGGREGWSAAGVDEFLRSYLQPRGRAAFYAALRSIYLEAPHGETGFWTRLASLEPPSLFVWGRRDPLVPIAFAEHVRRAVPHARHLELSCGHVPQLERPKAVHGAMRRFLTEGDC